MAGNNPQTTLPPVPRESLIDSRGAMSAQWTRWMQQIQRILSFAGGIAWDVVNKAESKLSDIETRPHSQLQDIAGTGANHISEAENAEITALDGLGTGMVAKTDDAAYAARSIQGTASEVNVTNGDGIAADPVISLPDVIEGPRSFGTAVNNTTFEEDGTAKFNGAATVWKDVMFPMAPPKTSGAGNPSIVTYNGNLRGYSFAVNDVHDFDPQEMEHDSKVGSTATFHIHWLSRSNDGTDRAVKWELEYDEEPGSGPLPVTTTASVEVVIPAGSAVNTVQRTDITTFTITAIARLVGARVKRVVSTGAAPSVDPVLRALHFHYEIDTVGSRQILTK